MRERERQILLMGLPYFLNRLQELGADSDFKFVTMPKTKIAQWAAMLRADALYLIGGDLRPNRFYHLALLLGKKVIMHWVGSDILEMRNWHKRGGHFSELLLKKATHWAEVDWTAAELTELRVAARIVPLSPAGLPETVKEWPEKFVALTYLPPERPDFYGLSRIINLAREFPEVVFLAVAAPPQNRPEDWPENLIPIGWVDDMAELYQEVTVLIRLTEHDGLSFMVLEALGQAREVIWTYPLSGVNQVRNDRELTAVLRRLVDAFNRGELPLNQPGRELVTNEYNPAVVWSKIQNGIEQLWGASDHVR